MASDERARGPGGDAPAREDVAEGRSAEEFRRQGLPGKGFDPGGGYGGAGNASAYSGESSYGGQAGYGGNSLRGAYAGGEYGREEASARGDEPAADEGGEGGAPRGAEVQRGTDEQSGGAGGSSAADRERGGRLADGDVGFDPSGPLGGERRDETR
jgi:heterogeneous nuclear ribonucleoprotein A1/A3